MVIAPHGDPLIMCETNPLRSSGAAGVWTNGAVTILARL